MRHGVRTIDPKSVRRLWLAVFLDGVIGCLLHKKFEIVPTIFEYQHNAGGYSKERAIKWKLIEFFDRNSEDFKWSETPMFESLCSLVHMPPHRVRERFDQRPEGYHPEEIIIKESYDLSRLKHLRETLKRKESYKTYREKYLWMK